MPLQVNTSKIICLNLSSLNIEQIFSVSEYYKLSFESLVEMKKENVFKLWCEPKADFAIAASYTDSKDRILWNEAYSSPTSKEYKKVINTPITKVPKVPKTIDSKRNYEFFKSNGYNIYLKSFENKEVEVSVCLDVDTILDKIKIEGIQSLTKKEKEFLDNVSKNM